MRLTHLKLAGFKSFVDPTTITVPGQLVGVVGPNGCGKSNIIDAVRWVLGESRASALRGESMMDVIFNGSSQRKPVGRASVELVFDNTMGRAAGQWSQYAEIAVKRILTRDGDSSYHINNTQVRRRDVYDIFLGTGVGPRAYAIIEQGMISRVIDAKPEDLRVFLEEAAGISKYKERRRETEHRLEDTRENLARVDDIRRELDAQIDKLTRQAELAREFQTIKAEQETKQQLLWLIRKRDAETEATRLGSDIAGVVNEVEAETAKLREVERRLEVTRTQHYEAGDTVNAAQGVLYGVNSEVSRLEAELKFITETRTRLHTQGVQLIEQLALWGRQSGELREALGMWQGRRSGLTVRQTETKERASAETGRLPELEQVFRAAQSRVQEARDRILEVQRTIQVEEAHRTNARRALEGFDARTLRLQNEVSSLGDPDLSVIAGLEAQLEGFAQQLARLEDEARTVGIDLPQREQARTQTIAERERLDREANLLDGRLATLRKIQARVNANEPVDRWLERNNLAALPRLWQQIEVAAGWEASVESVLRERLHALALTTEADLERLIESPPPARLTAFVGAAAETTATNTSGGRALASLVTAKDAGIESLVRDWLQGFIAVESKPSAGDRAALAPGYVLVDRAGHHYRRHAVSFYAPDDGDSGILARNREIDELAKERAALEEARVQVRESATAAESAFRGANGRLTQLRSAIADAGRDRHRVELEHLKLIQARDRVRDRRAAIDTELAEIGTQRVTDATRLEGFSQTFTSLDSKLGQSRADFDAVHQEQVAADQSLARQRQTIQVADRDAQEAVFAVRECDAKIDEVARSLNSMIERVVAATAQERSLRDEVGSLQDADLRVRLQELLGARVQAEEKLSGARDKHEALTTELRSTEEGRLGTEQRLSPLRERINELRLKEQASQLAFEQFSLQLTEVGANEAALVESLEKAPRPSALQADINRLTAAISQLGAINMAALSELDTSRERKDYLDAQATDLAEALTTLESAIKKIDLETRSLLQSTFDTVNTNFSDLFPLLFGGGQARLEMTGEEILDAGVQVIAQPPGKRNQSIHLLSGGEKALTAISLVFALFRLNPAPFCLLDEVDAPLDDANTERFCKLVKRMSAETQFMFISHSKITMEIAEQLIGVTMQEQGVSRIVAVDIDEALRLREAA